MIQDLNLRLRALFAHRRVERELDEELAFHLERETQKHVANGMSVEEARTLARARFGSPTVQSSTNAVPRASRHSSAAVMTLRTMARMATYLLQIAFWLTLVLGGLALALTLSGLFSVLSYVVEQRKREIGVRMALGATVRDVAGMVLSQAVRPVSAGIATGAGLAGALAMLLMSTPAAAAIGTIVHVFDPIAYGGSILFIVAACALASLIPSIRAARVDPMTALRQE